MGVVCRVVRDCGDGVGGFLPECAGLQHDMGEVLNDAPLEVSVCEKHIRFQRTGSLSQHVMDGANCRPLMPRQAGRQAGRQIWGVCLLLCNAQSVTFSLKTISRKECPFVDSLCEPALEPCIRTLESSRINSMAYH